MILKAPPFLGANGFQRYFRSVHAAYAAFAVINRKRAAGRFRFDDVTTPSRVLQGHVRVGLDERARKAQNR